MGVTASIIGDNSKRGVEVTSREALHVAVDLIPAKDRTRAGVTQRKVLSEKFTNSSGSDLMNVDGSSTAVDFTIAATGDRIKYITEVRFQLYDEQTSTASQELRRFGSAAAAPGLTNGVLLATVQGGERAEIFVETEGTGAGVRNLTQFYLFASEIRAITGAVASTIDAFWVLITLPQPVGLFPGSSDRLVITIQDDLTSINSFEALAYGYYELLEGG